MTKNMCDICGKGPYKNAHGLTMHKIRGHGVEKDGAKPKRQYNKKSAPVQIPVEDGTVSINVPCEIGGNRFGIDIQLSIAGTAIRPV